MQLQQIVNAACIKAKGPGMLSLGGQGLTTVLEDLKYNKNLKVNRVVIQFSIAAGSNGPFALPADYLRMYDLFFPLPTSGGGTSPGLPQFLRPITMEQYDSEFKDPSMSNYPWFFATDLSTAAQVWSGGQQGQGTLTSAGNLFVYPQSSGIISLTMRYFKNQPDYTTPETSTTVPWFSYSQYLIMATAAWMADITGDDRQQTWVAEADKLLRPHLIMEGDEQQTVKKIQLDPRTFHNTRNLKLTKASPL